MEPPAPRPHARARAVVNAQLWARVVLAQGVELHLDVTRYQPSGEDLLAIQQEVRRRLGGQGGQAN